MKATHHDLHRLMNFRENFNESRLVCIANVKTNEVLRIPYVKALKFMFEEVTYKDKNGKEKTKTVPKREGWTFTAKKVYKQFVDSQLGIVPAPKFTYFDRKTGKTLLKNTFSYVEHS